MVLSRQVRSDEQRRRNTTMGASIIALTGKPGVGKDTIGDFLAINKGFARIAFADALRREVSEAWRVDMRMLTDRPTKEWPIPALAAGMCSEASFMRWCADGGESLTEPRSPRWILQRWASFQRRYKPDYYARMVVVWIEQQVNSGYTHIVVTDLRDPVEEALLRVLGAKVVRVHRPQLADLAGDTATHVSEQHHRILADADILNDGSLQALADATLQCVEELQGCRSTGTW
jgi:hypothetical protein